MFSGTGTPDVCMSRPETLPQCVRLLTYNSPILLPGTLRRVGQQPVLVQDIAVITGASTAGEEYVEMDGKNLGADPSMVRASFHRTTERAFMLTTPIPLRSPSSTAPRITRWRTLAATQGV